MSWGYWGIVAGLAAMLAVLFVCVAILYAGRTGPRPDAAGSSADQAKDATPGSRHAA